MSCARRWEIERTGFDDVLDAAIAKHVTGRLDEESVGGVYFTDMPFFVRDLSEYHVCIAVDVSEDILDGRELAADRHGWIVPAPLANEHSVRWKTRWAFDLDPMICIEALERADHESNLLRVPGYTEIRDVLRRRRERDDVSAAAEELLRPADHER